MNKIVFSGCSFTAGSGWNKDNIEAECKSHPDLWVNLCCNQINQLKNLEIINIGVGGSSNTEIFELAAQTIAEYGFAISVMFCEWTSMPRYIFDVGFELWPTTERIPRGSKYTHDINLNCGKHWDRKYINDLLDRFFVLHHLHREIIKVVRYSSILQKLAQKFNIKLYFINGLCPWDQDYFVRLVDAMPEQYTPFTKKEILNIESRNDEDIFKLYKLMHDNYDLAGGIDTSDWVNLYNSMQQNLIDTNYDNKHPGTKSNQLYFQTIKTFLENQ